MDKNKKVALEIVKRLRKNKFQAYFVGGCVRDMVMKKTPDDYDIATDAMPGEIRKVFKKTVFVGAQFGTVLVIENGIHFEVTTFRSGRKNKFSSNSKEDALNRDFTINGLLYDPMERKVIDYCDGKSDIKKKVIRCIGNPLKCFKQDRLRPLRAVRFACTLNFKIEQGTFSAIKKFKEEIKKVSKERIKVELVELLTGKDPYRGMKLLNQTGLLAAILPEVETLKGVEQPPKFHPEGDVFVHTMLLLKKLKKTDTILSFACLLHDIGKPATYEKKDRIRFNNHDKVGARMSEEILKRLRFSNDEIKKIVYCIDNHMRVMNAMKMREATLKRMFLKDTFLTELELHKLDCMASHSDLKIYKFLKKKYAEFKKRPVAPKPFLNGYEVMNLGFKQGPIIGKIQKELINLQLERKIKSKAEAKEWLRRKWKTKSA